MPSFLVYAQVQQAADSFHVSGVVINAATRAPLPRCRLSMTLEPSARDDRRREGNEPLLAQTDGQGRFAFELPASGHWQLNASAAGFHSQTYHEHEGYSSAIVVGRSIVTPDLRFTLQPDAVVAGTVLDEAAEPVRNATVSLQIAKPAGASGGIMETAFRRQTAMTDDRGHYEIAGIAPGRFHVSVQATPWYAAAAGGRGRSASTGSFSAFDMVYPVTWYPGVFNAAEAADLDLHAGETRRADFNLLPIPSAHLRTPPPEGGSTEQRFRSPTIERVDAGQPSLAVLFPQAGPNGQMEFGGLSPGLYRVGTPGPDGGQSLSYVQVQAGSNASLSEASSLPVSDLQLQFDGGEAAPRAGVALTDTATGAVYRNGMMGPFGLRRRVAAGTRAGPANAELLHLTVPAGTYRVALSGDPEVFLTGLTFKGKTLNSRVISLQAGAATLTLHVQHGRAAVTGRVVAEGKPLEGAMVMLVPASFGQPGSLDMLRRDQSNTDGSFELQGVIPGQYILLAIDRGWEVNWQDAATLQRYLLHGLPLTLAAHGSVEQEIAGQAP